MKQAFIAASFLSVAAASAVAAPPPFETTAPIAYLVDLSSGAVLYAKDADRQIPPASMAKMMTTHIVFDMIKKGELKLDQKFTVRPETWQKWHGPSAGSTMFLSPGEQVSIENLLHGVVTLSGNDACVVLAEGIAGTEEAFVARMNGGLNVELTIERFENRKLVDFLFEIHEYVDHSSCRIHHKLIIG